MVKTKVINIDKFWETPATVSIKKFTAGDLAELRDSISVNVIGTTQSSSPMMGQLFLLTLMKGIYQAPFMKGQKITMEEVRELDGNLADYIFDEINKYNEVSPN